MAIALPDAPATARNRDPILAVLRQRFAMRMRVLEIGSGTGQHAVYFARALPHLKWHTSDLPENHEGIRAWIAQSGASNIFPPVPLDFGRAETFPITRHDAVFSANTLHIASWPQVESLFANLPRVLAAKATVVFYGPFNVGGQFTSPSNAAFDASLRADDPSRGIRDVEAVQALAERAGLRLVDNIEMPANNRCLVFEK
jgi:cyclopropane fatty-acyl-phospholipid synthase-like methyltransferase